MALPSLAHRLTVTRQSANLSREQAAIAAGRSWSTLAAYERGLIIPPLPVLSVLADLYGVRLVDLLDEEALHVGA